MNDFFNVLDDFSFEEFVAAEAPDDGSNLSASDTASDSSSDPKIAEETDAELNEVVTDANEITQEDVNAGKNFVWEQGTNPFSGGRQSGIYLSFSSTRTYRNSNNVTVQEVSLRVVESVTFASSNVTADNIDTAEPLVIDSTNFGVIATKAVTISLSGGRITGGTLSGSGAFKIGRWISNADGQYGEGAITVNVKGFETANQSDDVVFTANNDNLLSINVPEIDGGTITVNGGDFDFTLNNAAVNITKYNTTDPGEIVFTYGENGDLKLDASEVKAADGKTLAINAAGGADTLVVPTTGNDAGAIKIGSKSFEYVSGGSAYFTLNGNEAKAFVLVDANDAFVAEKDQAIDIYDEETDNLVDPLISVSGAKYAITKISAGTYTASILNSATVEIGDTKLEFNISSTTKKAFEKAAEGITITFNDDGEIESVDGLYNFVYGDTMKVTGNDVTEDDGGLPIIAKKGAAETYISISDGDFLYAGTAKGEAPVVYVADGAQILAVDEAVDVIVGDSVGNVGGGKVQDVDGVLYEYSGDGYFTANAAGNITGFVFVSKDDYVKLPTSDAIPVYYNNTLVDVPDVTDTDGAFKVALDSDGNFVVSELTLGSTVVGDNMTITTIGADNEVIFNVAGDIIGVDEFVGLIELPAAVNGSFSVNDETLTYTSAGVLTVAGDATGVAVVEGLTAGDSIKTDDPLSDAEFIFVSDSTDGVADVYTVNGVQYLVTGDKDGVSISADGKVTGLDENATLKLNPVADVTVNEVDYTAEQLANGDPIVGYLKKNGKDGSYLEDPNYPLFNSKTNAEIATYLGIPYGVYGADNMFYESLDDNVEDHSADTIQAQVFLDDDGDVTTKFNDMGKNLAVVTAGATGDKNIILGAKGDAVILNGQDENGHINVTVGGGNDTIVVKGPAATDAVLRGAATKTTIDMGGTANKDSVDKIITYAQANANITLNNYDETGKSGVVLHDPEIPYIKDLTAAVEDGLLVFEDSQVVAIDRDETATGVDRKTSIKVNNVNSAHQSMIRLYGYKDNPDTYEDDFGQLVGFTSKNGGTLDASDLEEDVVLIGNVKSKNSKLVDGDKTAGSNLVGTKYDDVLFGGGNDTLNAGKGENLIKLVDDADRDAATVVIGEGKDVITGLQTGFNGDIINADLASADTELSFDGTNLVVSSATDKFTATAVGVADNAQFVEQTFVSDSETYKAAVAVDGGTIAVTGDDVPNYYKATNGAIDFSNYTGAVEIDIDGDWTTSKVGDETVTVAGAVNTLAGGSGNTLFKGGAGNETLIAGTGESSLYGAGGKNVLQGSSSEDKFGSTEFFVQGINNGAQNTITGFEFIADGGSNQATFDALALGMADGTDVIDLKVTGTDLEIAVKGGESGATEKVTIEGAAGKEFLVDRGTDTETVAQIVANENVINHDYVDFYSATEDHATIKVGDVNSAKVWLDAPDFNDGVEYVGSYDVIDARGSSATVELVGQDNHATTIYGGLGNASMWGGAGNANDLLVGGSAHNEFYFEANNGHDTIMSANDGDIIHLGVSLDQIDFENTNITSTGVEVALTDGSKLSINSTAEVSFSLDDGTAAKVNRQTQQFE